MLGLAFLNMCLYVGQLRKTLGVTEPLPQATIASSLDKGDGLITKPLDVLGNIAKGNIVLISTMRRDGRCYFPNHTFCKVGNTYYDPTFNLVTPDREAAVQFKISHMIGKIRVGTNTMLNKTFVYAWDPQKSPGFSDTWYEIKGEGWISAQDWKNKTSRMGHNRSKELDALDKALKAFEDTGFSKYRPLGEAFKNWFKNNPREAAERNKGGCVNGLAKFLEVPNVSLPNK